MPFATIQIAVRLVLGKVHLAVTVSFGMIWLGEGCCDSGCIWVRGLKPKPRATRFHDGEGCEHPRAPVQRAASQREVWDFTERPLRFLGFYRVFARVCVAGESLCGGLSSPRAWPWHGWTGLKERRLGDPQFKINKNKKNNNSTRVRVGDCGTFTTKARKFKKHSQLPA